MKLMREDVIHYYMRAGLRNMGWLLLAGEYPNGSDDELRALNIVDRAVARDRSPRPRHHLVDKIVPDLVAYREGVVLVIEAKVGYDREDERKLRRLLTVRRPDFEAAFGSFMEGFHRCPGIQSAEVVPTLAFAAGAVFPRRTDFAYIEVGANGKINYTPREGESQ